jgi:predicted DNA-binding protein
MPNQPKTPMKSFRISEDLYRAALNKAEREGKTLSDVVREALEKYVEAR